METLQDTVSKLQHELNDKEDIIATSRRVSNSFTVCHFLTILEFSLMIGTYYSKQTIPPVYNKLCNKGMVRALIWGQNLILITMFAVNR